MQRDACDRRIRRTSALVVAVAAVGAWAAVGCLPAGGPPTGQRWLSGRTLVQVQIVSGAAGAPPSVLVFDEATSAGADLYGVADPGPAAVSSQAPTAAAGARLLLSGTDATPYAICGSRPCTLLSDSQGRVLATRPLPSPPSSPLGENFRVDPVTGEAVDLGPAGLVATSPSGARIFLLDPTTENGRIRELDDQETALAGVQNWAFIGEDLFVTEASVDSLGQASYALLRVRPGGQPETIAPGVYWLAPLPLPSVVAAGRDSFLELARMNADGTMAISFFDPATLTETPVPGALQSVSPDGRWLEVQLPQTSTSPAFELLDRTTGATQALDGDQGMSAWRPGHDELWANAAMADPPTGQAAIQIWQAGGGTTITPVMAELAGYRPSASLDSPFTPDGRHWFSSLSDGSTSGRIYVGSADDPTAPIYPVNPPGTGPGKYWPLADGRLLIEAFITDINRNDIYLVDPDTGQSRALASGGHVIAIGPTRAIALLGWVTASATGDLTLIDFDTGATTLLGQNVSVVALQRPADPGADALAPGLRVAFLVHDRIPSPYDGLWVATLP